MSDNELKDTNATSLPVKSTGKYVFDKKTGKVVKVSDEIPSHSKASQDGACPHRHTCSGACSH